MSNLPASQALTPAALAAAGFVLASHPGRGNARTFNKGAVWVDFEGVRWSRGADGEKNDPDPSAIKTSYWLNGAPWAGGAEVRRFDDLPLDPINAEFLAWAFDVPGLGLVITPAAAAARGNELGLGAAGRSGFWNAMNVVAENSWIIFATFGAYAAVAVGAAAAAAAAPVVAAETIGVASIVEGAAVAEVVTVAAPGALYTIPADVAAGYGAAYGGTSVAELAAMTGAVQVVPAGAALALPGLNLPSLSTVQNALGLIKTVAGVATVVGAIGGGGGGGDTVAAPGAGVVGFLAPAPTVVSDSGYSMAGLALAALGLFWIVRS